MPVYVVDSNFFIQAHRANYPLDVAQGFWNAVKRLAEQGVIISIDKVKGELYDKNDELESWCRANLPDGFFKDSSSVIDKYSQVSAWAISRSSHYKPQALQEFLDAEEADAFLVAFALADPKNRILVTQEVSDPNTKKKVKIPEACDALSVSYINLIQMFRQLGVTF